MIDRWRHELLSRWAHLVCDYPRLVLLAAAGLAVIAVAYTTMHLTFQSDRNDLISPELQWNARYIQYRRDFQGPEHIVVLVRIPEDDAGRAAAQRFVDRLAAELRADAEHFAAVWEKIELRPMLVRLLPIEQYEQRMIEMAAARPLLESQSIGQFLSELAAQMQPNAPGQSSAAARPDAAEAHGQIGRIERIVQAIGAAVEGADPAAALAQAELMAGEPHQYLQTADRSLMIVDIEIRPIVGRMDPYGPAVQAARSTLHRVQTEFPGIEAGLTGMPVIEADETFISMRDSTRASTVALLAIAVLLIVAFHGWQLPMLSVVGLGVGVAWSFGFLTLAVGHLQVLSVVFTVILLGLGIDYAIHTVSRFELIRHTHRGEDGFRLSLLDTLQTTGPGIITGAITTAFAFSTTMLTKFKGMAEMGLIAGVGVLLCMVAMLSVLPALMRLLRPQVHHLTPRELRRIDMHAQEWLMPFVNHPYPTLIVAGLLAGTGLIGLVNVRYDNNLLNMLPRGLDSVRWIERLEASGESIWGAVGVTDDLDEARRWAEKLREMPTVESLGGIGRIFPSHAQQKIALARQVRETLGEELLHEPVLEAVQIPRDTPADIRQRLQALAFSLRIAMNRQDVLAEPAIVGALQDLSAAISHTLAVLDDEQHAEVLIERIAGLQAAFRLTVSAAHRQILQATEPRPMVLDDLPSYLQREAVSLQPPQRYALKAYPLENVWHPPHLAAFLRDVRQVIGEKRLTGPPVQIHESGQLMKRSYQLAGLLAVLVVLLLVYLDFYNPLDALLCLLPVAWGFVMTLGAMWLTGVAINPANLMVMPLLFGIGVASSVHMLHRYRQARYRRPLGLSEGTGKGIILTSLTTIIAFSSMLIAQHRGIQTLGFVMSVGISMTLIACLTIMPAVLELRNRYHVWCRIRQWKKAAEA